MATFTVRPFLSGASLYATWKLRGSNTYWNGSGLTIQVVADWPDYAVALLETPTGSYNYLGTVPAGLPGTVSTPRNYDLEVFMRGGTFADPNDPAVSDFRVFYDEVVWDGERLLSAGQYSALLVGQRVTTVTVQGLEEREAGMISVYRGATLSQPFEGLVDLTARTKLYFTVKRLAEQPDAESLAQIVEVADPASTALLYLAGAAPTDPTAGSITVTDAAEGELTVYLAPAATALLAPGRYRYDLRLLADPDVAVLGEGVFLVREAVTGAIS